MKLKIEVSIDNAAFEDTGEVLHVLNRANVFFRTFNKGDRGNLIDANGNTCGQWKVTQ